MLPAKFKAVVLKSMHNGLDHLGVERVTDMIRCRFFWPKMLSDVEEYVRNCGEYVLRKTPCQRATPLHQIVSSGPMDLVFIDFLSMEPDSRGISNVLVITDHFTRYAQAFPTKKPSQLQRSLWRSILCVMACHHGFIPIKAETLSLTSSKSC